MKRIHLLILLTVVSLSVIFWEFKVHAQGSANFQASEYGTIRWAGRQSTFFIRPNGKVEILGPLLAKAPRPEHIDERTFYMNVAVNAVAREGFEVAAIGPDEVLMRRSVSR